MLVRFGVVGIANTLISFIIIMGALWVGLHDYAANLLGYCAGLCFSYFANRRWTFKAAGSGNIKEVSQFLLTFAVAYGVNFLLLSAARGAGYTEHPFSHLLGMAGYTATFFAMARLWVFHTPITKPRGLRHIMAERYPEVVLAVMALSAFLLLRNIGLTHDVVWQFWIARQILGGAKLYSDIWEINPPLWFWSAVPLQYVAGKASLSPFQLYVAVIIIMSFGSALLMGHLMSFTDVSRRLAVMAIAFSVMVLLPHYDFGQREQLALICALPYAALIARRHSGRAVPTGLALAVGLFSAYGFALKHYFIAIPLSLELWLLTKQRRQWGAVRPEILALTACAVIYATSVVIFAPDFLTRMVPMVNTAYDGYITPWSRQIYSPILKMWLAALICLILYRKSLSKHPEPEVIAFLLMTGGFALSYFAQRKGWLYHSVPVTAGLLVAIAIHITRQGFGKIYKYPFGLVIITFTISLHFMFGPYENFYKVYSDRFLSIAKKDEAVLVLSSEPMLYWPMGDQRQLKWISPLYTYWMLPSIGKVKINDRNNRDLINLSNTIRKRTVNDIKCYSPTLILIERKRFYEMQPKNFNVRNFFLSNNELRLIIKENYLEGKHSDHLYIYIKKNKNVFHQNENQCRKIS